MKMLVLVGALVAVATGALAQSMELKDTASGKCWSVPTLSEAGDGLTLATCNGSANQQLTLDAPSGNIYESGVAWGYCLREDTVAIDTCWTGYAEKWSMSNGYVMSQSTGKALLPNTSGVATLAIPPTVTTTPPGTWVNDQQAAAPAGDFAPSGYTQVWGDEFNQPNLDTTHWWTRESYSGGLQQSNNDVVSRYMDTGNHVMTGSTLKLMALPSGSAGSGLYATGMIRSKATVPLASGAGFYVAERAKVPNGMGTWLAFWLAPDDRGTVPSWPPELGPMEIITNSTRTTGMVGLDIQTNGEAWPGPIFNTTVTGNIPAAWSGAYNIDWPPFDTSAGFHVYGLLYKAGAWSASIDGTVYAHGTYNWNYSAGVAANPASIICNFDLGGSTGGPVDNSKMPQAYEIDFVRVYAEPGAPALGVSTIGVNTMPASGG